MVADRQQRLRAASALARILGSPAWQEAVKDGDYVSGQQVILALETDTLADVRSRVEEYEPPVHIAVYSQPAEGRAKMHFLVMEPAQSIPQADEVVDIDPCSTIGMFCDYLDRRDQGVCVRLTKWQPHPIIVREFALCD